MWMINDENLSIFHVAALHRDESIYRIIHETCPMLEVLHGIKDGNGNNMLHLIGTNPRGNLLEAVPRAAFQMQRQLLWFKGQVQGKISKKRKTEEHPRSPQFFGHATTKMIFCLLYRKD